MRLHTLPHHDGSQLYSPGDTTTLGGRRVVRVRVPTEFGPVASIFLRVLVDGEPRFSPMTVETPATEPGATWWSGAFTLDNAVTTYRFLVNRADGTALWLNAEGCDPIEPVDTQDFRVTTFTRPPAWATRQVLYQVFPDRFARSAAADDRAAPSWALAADWDDQVVHTGPDTPRQYFGGDLDGITEHLDHLTDLGVTLLYLTPFFPARSNHRYDASTFDEVDPLLGGDDALVRLVEEAHARGIRVIGDLTTNHTGDAHEWFLAAHHHPEAPESEFYYWKDAAHDDYVAWADVPSLPKLNWNSAELRRRFVEGPTSVVARWLLPPFNLDGWRIDVANQTGRFGTDDLNREVQRTVRATMNAVSPDTVLYAESTNDASRDFDGEGWQAPMSYAAFTRPLWHWLRRGEPHPRHHFGIPYEIEPRYTAAEFVATYRRFTAAFPWPVRQLAMNAINTHDTPRFAERADDAAQLVAAGLSLTLPGTPVLFAGDEFGISGVNGEDARAPLPWGTEPRLGRAYRALTRLRTGSAALQDGALRWLDADDDVLAFTRETADERVVVVAARAAATLTLPLSAIGPVLAAEVTFGDVAVSTDAEGLTVTTQGPAFIVLPAPSTAPRASRSPEPAHAAAVAAH